MPERPVVTFDPAVKFGAPCVRGVPVESLAGNVHAGDSVESAAEGYGLTRPEVLVACWWIGVYGPKTWQMRWRTWALGVYGELWQRRYDVADPPTREVSDGS